MVYTCWIGCGLGFGEGEGEGEGRADQKRIDAMRLVYSLSSRYNISAEINSSSALDLDPQATRVGVRR